MAEAKTTIQCPCCSERLEFTIQMSAVRRHRPGVTEVSVVADRGMVEAVMEAHLSSRFERFGTVEDHEALVSSG